MYDTWGMSELAVLDSVVMVSTVVTPSATRACKSLWSNQKGTHEMTTIKAAGMKIRDM